MSLQTIKVFTIEIFSKPPKKVYATNKTNVYHIDDIWNLDLLDMKDYCPDKNRGYRHVLVLIDNFSMFGFTLPLKNKNAQTIKDSFEKNSDSSKRKSYLFESDREKELFNSNFQK